MTEETKSGKQGQESQSSTNGDRGGRRKRYNLGESNNAIEGWSVRIKGGSAESETEKDGMIMGKPEGSADTLMTSPWGT